MNARRENSSVMNIHHAIAATIAPAIMKAGFPLRLICSFARLPFFGISVRHAGFLPVEMNRSTIDLGPRRLRFLCRILPTHADLFLSYPDATATPPPVDYPVREPTRDLVVPWLWLALDLAYPQKEMVSCRPRRNAGRCV